MVGEEGECRVLYDDDMQERLTLPRERFRWLAPRACSAGATPALYVRPGCLLVCAVCYPRCAWVWESPACMRMCKPLAAHKALLLHLPLECGAF